MKKIFLVAAVAASAVALSSCGSSKNAGYYPYAYPPYQQQAAQQPYYQAPQQQVAQQAYYQTPQQQVAQSELKGSAKKAKEWKEQGFELVGSLATLTMEEALEMHNTKVFSDTDRYTTIMGSGTDVGGELSTARLWAQNDASISYATSAGSVISGAIARAASNFSELGTKLQGAYTQKVREYITPYLKESVAIKRITDRGIEVQVFYIIDEQNAYKVRKDAMDKALKETATEQVFGTMTDEWVKQTVSNE